MATAILPAMHDTGQSSSGLTFALQALLSRHETYVAESQQEHARMNANVARLENERTSLQRSNEKIVAENKELLSKLDTLNSTYLQSDDTVKGLEALLRDTEIEVRRLNGLARRAEELEAQVQDLDQERSHLKRRLDDGEQESRSTLSRWRESEKKVKQLEHEVEKIEWEAKRQRDQHDDVVARLERERVLERELGGAEGRLKGAAALQGIESGTGGNVVSHFVKDILNDNASLQAGIVELRELLQSSNDEVQNLRQQIVHHQPIDTNDSEEPLSQSVSLDQQLGWDQPSPDPPQREVHVHHHYHAKLAQKRDRPPTIRRTSRRRAVVGYGASPMSSTPSTPTTRPQRMFSSPVIPFQLHQPQPKAHRLSASTTLSSNFSSIPSSPRSGLDHYGSIFDRLDTGEISSRPTSPESAAGYHSPTVKPRPGSFEAVLEDDDEVPEALVEEPSIRSGQHTPSAQNMTPNPSRLAQMNAGTVTPPERKTTNGLLVPAENVSEIATPQTQIHVDYASPSVANIEIRPTLHRSSSHDSLLSISGMDIHLPRQRQQPASSMRIKGNQAHFAISPSISATRTIPSSTPVAGITDATVISSKRSFSSDNQGASLRGLERVVGLPSARTEEKNASGFGRLMGGWVSRKWGVAPMKSAADSRSSSSLTPRQQATQAAPSSPLAVPKRPTLASVLSGGSGSGIGSMGRTPGINQSGMIPGFFVPRDVVERPTKLEVGDGEVDEEGLRKALREGASDGEE